MYYVDVFSDGGLRDVFDVPNPIGVAQTFPISDETFAAIQADSNFANWKLVDGELQHLPQVTPTADQNKTKAEKLLSDTDWVNQPDVVNPSVNPHLLNPADFISYRAALRSIAVNPQAGDLVWPEKPQEQWS
jgi:hypothetical protein